MKTKIILATLLMLALPMTAKNKKEQNKFASQKAVLTGIWQQCLPQPTADGGIHVRFIPQYKILCGDGTFYNMAQMNPSAPAALYVSGIWSMASDSTFVEHIETIDTDTKSKGMDNELTFRLFEDNNVLGITYTMPGNGMRGKEVWMRVQKGNAVAIAQKYFERLNGKMEERNGTPKNEKINSTTPPTKDSVLIVINGEQCSDITSDFIINGTHDDYEKFLNKRNLTLDRIDIWKNEKKKDQFRQKFGNWVKSVIEITARPTDRPTENPRGIYKLMSLKGNREIKPYIGDIYKIVTDSVTMRLQVNNANRKIFMIDIPDFRPFNYTGARTDLDLIDKSTRVYDSNSKRFTQKWWSTIPNHTIFPYNQWCYEFYESGKYSEAAKTIFDELRTSQQPDPKNQLIGTWKNTMEIQMIAGDGVENWVENLKKVDNWKDMLAYLNQTNPKREYDQNDFAEYYIFTPSKHFFFAMFYKRQLVAGEYDNITYNGKETFVSGDNQNRRIYWLTKDAFVMNSNPVGKEKWCIYERVTDKNTMLSRICSHFIQHKE